MGGGDGESQGETYATPDKAKATLEKGKTRMTNQNENAAVSDVTARMREEANILSLLNGQSVGVASVVNKLREFADSIDAAVSKTETTTPGNNAAIRKALNVADETACVLLNWSSNHYQELNCMGGNLRRALESAANAPWRNCDRFGGNIDLLRETCLRERGLNPEEDFSEVFCEWLLELAGKRGAV